MSWFEEQIKQREQQDIDSFEDSFRRLAGSVIGQKLSDAITDEREQARGAVTELCRYYHIKEVSFPDHLEKMEDILEYVLRPQGFMWREVELKKGWYKNAAGAMLGELKEGDLPVTLFPHPIRGYYYLDPATGERIRLTHLTEKNLKLRGLCFYRPFAQKSLGPGDLLRFIWDNLDKRSLILYLVLSLVIVFVGMMVPDATEELFSHVVDIGKMGILFSMMIYMLCIQVSLILIKMVQSLVISRVSMQMDLYVESASMMRLLSLPAGFFRRYSSGEIADRLDCVGQLISELIEIALTNGIASIFSLIFIAQVVHYAPALVVPSLAVTILTVVVSTCATLFEMQINKRMMEAQAKENGMNYAMISGIQKIRLSGSEKRMFARWAGGYSKVTGFLYNPPLFVKLSTVIVQAISLIGMITMYFLAVQSGVKVSEYYAFTAAYGIVSGAFSALAGTTASFARIKPIIDMAAPILKASPEDAGHKEIVTTLGGNIELSNVTFRYQENMPKVLNGLSLKIKAGQYVAIVGKTGCGKSTLMRILLGFETPQKGAVYYDGRDLNDLDLRSLRRGIGSVMQNGKLLSGDIYSNIAISSPMLTLEEAWEAARIAGLDEDIREMPMGMNTILSEGEGAISGGQKQRLMIARAIAPRPSILMFDEATSALDNITQKKISDALAALSCTRIVIAHRLSTVKNCDRIILLDKGRIVEDGSYEELIRRNGGFAKLVKKQRLDEEGIS